MSARHFTPRIPASQARTDAGPYLNPFPHEDAASLATMAPLFASLAIDARIADLDAQIARWHANADEADAEAQEQARADALEAARIADDELALRDAQDAGDVDADGEPVPYDRYCGGV